MKEIYNKLLKHFGKQLWWPTISKSGNEKIFEICIGAILTQNTSWNNVEKAMRILKQKNLLNKERLSKLSEKQIASLIKPSGYYNQKARKIKEFINFLDSNKEISRENLLSIWGIGKETADSILCYAFNQPYFVVDAYTKRIFSRIGFKEENYNEVQHLVEKNLDSKHFNEFHALLVKLGKDYCKKEPKCNECPLNNKCKIN